MLQETNQEYFKLSSDWNRQAQTIDAQSTKDINVTVKLLKSPTSLQSASFNIELTAVADNTTTNP